MQSTLRQTGAVLFGLGGFVTLWYGAALLLRAVVTALTGTDPAAGPRADFLTSFLLIAIAFILALAVMLAAATAVAAGLRARAAARERAAIAWSLARRASGTGQRWSPYSTGRGRATGEEWPY